MAELTIAEPAWAAVVLAGGAALWVYRSRGAPRAAGTAFALAVAGMLILMIGSQAGAWVLLLAAVTATIASACAAYAASHGSLGGTRRALCITLRGLAWMLILLIAARPGWDWTRTEWVRPAVLFLLDDSRSMQIADLPGSPSRAARVENAFRASDSLLRKLAENYEMRMASFGERLEEISAPAIAGDQSQTDLAAALSFAAALRSGTDKPPLLVVLISDGANNAARPEAVMNAARELAKVRCGVLTVLAGPRPGDVAEIEMSPINASSRVATRSRVQIGITGIVRGCAGSAIRAEVQIDGGAVQRESIAVARAEERFRRAITIDAPEPGVHRLTVRVEAAADRGGAVAERSTTLEVGWDRIRVLFLVDRPNPEYGFAARALRGDSRYEVVIQTVGDRGIDMSDGGYDVVVLAAAPRGRPDEGAAQQLVDDVRERGVGLLFAGGVGLLNEGALARSPLREICPTSPILRAARDGYRPVFRLTPAGLRHPIFASLASQITERAATDELMLAAGAAQLGDAGPLAQTLAATEDGDALLIVQDVGRGRTAVAAWEANWPWALESDRGAATHRALWRELVGWLANRRPIPWVITDSPDYSIRAIRSGTRNVEIRAGIAGAAPADLERARAAARLSLRSANATATRPGAESAPAAHASRDIPLRWEEKEWRATLTGGAAVVGRQQLIFECGAVETGGPPLSAATAFDIRDIDPESLPPTADPGLLREVAAATADFGGKFIGVDDLSGALRDMAATDRRRRVEHTGRVEAGEVFAPAWLGAVVLLLVAEWTIRRRHGAA